MAASLRHGRSVISFGEKVTSSQIRLVYFQYLPGLLLSCRNFSVAVSAMAGWRMTGQSSCLVLGFGDPCCRSDINITCRSSWLHRFEGPASISVAKVPRESEHGTTSWCGNAPRLGSSPISSRGTEYVPVPYHRLWQRWDGTRMCVFRIAQQNSTVIGNTACLFCPSHPCLHP